jgi:hypothetical protein
MAKNRILELKSRLEQNVREELRQKQLKEVSLNDSQRMEVEEAHLMEFNQFNMEWDQKMNEFQHHAGQLEQSMMDKHDNDISELRQNLDQSLSTNFKPSPEMLNLKKI